jgi:hypothetical protein
MAPSTIMGINQLEPTEKRNIYTRLIPPLLISKFQIPTSFIDNDGNDLLTLRGNPGSPSVEMSLRHKAFFSDPILFGHLTDTLNGQIHILLYILNDPESPRFDVDRMPDGRPTVFGTRFRNIIAEIAALQAGLAPGQIRRGLRMLSDAIIGFETFVQSLGHVLYFAEPLYYHNAVLFERYGFTYQKGRKLMERIQAGFSSGGDLLAKLDGTSPFRQSNAADSIRLRAWAIHDGLLGEPFNNVTMYKHVGKSAGIQTCPSISW